MVHTSSASGASYIPAAAGAIMRVCDGIALLVALVWLPIASCSQVDAREVMTVTVEASSFDDSALLDGGCYTDGCEPALTQGMSCSTLGQPEVTMELREKFEGVGWIASTNLDGLGWDTEQSRWSCTATDDVPCSITYTLNSAREVAEVEMYFSLMTKEFSVIVSTLNAVTGEYEAKLVEDVEYSSYNPQAEINAYLEPAPTTTSVKIEANIDTGDTINIAETYIIITAEDDEVVSESGSYSWIWGVIFMILLCCCGAYAYHKCCGGWYEVGSRSWSSSSASASASAANTTTINNIMPQPIQPPIQTVNVQPYANGAAPSAPAYAYPA